MIYEYLSKKVDNYISTLFTQHPDDRLFYHNHSHTLEVIDHVIEIGKFYTTAEEIMFILRTAASFHDTGYLFVGQKDHEEESVRIMADFLSDLKLPQSTIFAIGQCIMATKLPVDPVSQTEQILCDADTYHFGTTRFRETDPLIKKEVEALMGITFTHWIEGSIALLTNHQFYTSYCQQKLNGGKQQNIDWLRAQL